MRLCPARPFALALSALLLASSLFAADTTEPPPRVTDPLAAARTQIAAKRFGPALAELQKVNAPASADWNNLMGYALRKNAPPDLDGAQRHYDAALKIDPRHRGALEYAGELALMKGQMAVAEERVAALAQACASSCDELAELKKGIERYKANGNRWIP